MKRYVIMLALVAATFLGGAVALGHTYLSHNPCILHTTYHFDVRDVNGLYWYHKSLDAGDRVEAWHYSQYPGDPKVYRHSSYGCWQ